MKPVSELRKRGLRATVAGLLAGLVGSVASVVPVDASAQAYPSRPITFYVSIGTGSLFEAMFRLVAAEASKIMGQTIVVENKVGAGGKLGLQALMNSPPDGYTIGMTYSGVAVTRVILDEGFNVQPGKDYVPVSITFSSPLMLVANASAPFRDLNGLIAYAKANPGKLTASGTSPASNAHLSLAMLMSMTGADINVVTHRAEAPAIIDLLNGNVTTAVVSASIKPHIDSGKVFGIATTGPKRWGAFPNLPTLDESGMKGFNIVGWYGIVLPAGTPQAIVARVHDAFTRPLSNPDIRKRMQDGGMEAGGQSPEEFGTIIRGDIERMRPVLQKSGIKLDG